MRKRAFIALFLALAILVSGIVPALASSIPSQVDSYNSSTSNHFNRAYIHSSGTTSTHTWLAEIEEQEIEEETESLEKLLKLPTSTLLFLHAWVQVNSIPSSNRYTTYNPFSVFLQADSRILFNQVFRL